MTLQRLWAGWRMPYVSAAAHKSDCEFCKIVAGEEPDDVTYVVWRGRLCLAVLNTFPYASGHLMVMPNRHVADLEEIVGEEATELWAALSEAIRALKAAYHPDGVNVGANLGRAAGAGIPGHFHFHAVPRWVGDTNFTTALAETRVLPESLPDSWRRLREAWA